MLRWRPNTCDCEIQITHNFEFVDWVQKCPKHKNLNGQPLLDKVHSDHKTIMMNRGSINIPKIKILAAKKDRTNLRVWAQRKNDIVLLNQLSKLDDLHNDIIAERNSIRRTGTIEKNPNWKMK